MDFIFVSFYSFFFFRVIKYFIDLIKDDHKI